MIVQEGDVQLALPRDVVGVEGQHGRELLHEPGECQVGDAGVGVGAADVGVRAGEPALLEDFEFGGLALIWHLPDRGGEGCAALVECEGLVSVAEVGGDLSVDEGVFFARAGLEP